MSFGKHLNNHVVLRVKTKELKSALCYLKVVSNEYYQSIIRLLIMGWLKVYDWELQRWPEFRKIEIGRSDSVKYFKKFSRHFKIRPPLVNMISRKRGGGTYHASDEFIDLPMVTNFGLIIHEFAHHFSKVRFANRCHHDKRFKRCLKATYTFAKRYLPKDSV